MLAADWLGRWSARPRAASAAPAGESLFEPQVVAEFVGRFPAPQVSYDPAQPGRLYAGGQVSEDAGQSWRELVDPQGRRLVLLGGLRARAPVVGPGGHVLYAEVLFDEPGVPLGLGRLAHVVEWRNGGFEELLAWRRGLLDGPGAERAWPVARSFGYLPEGIPWVAQDETLASPPHLRGQAYGPEAGRACPKGRCLSAETTSAVDSDLTVLPLIAPSPEGAFFWRIVESWKQNTSSAVWHLHSPSRRTRSSSGAPQARVGMTVGLSRPYTGGESHDQCGENDDEQLQLEHGRRVGNCGIPGCAAGDGRRGDDL